jgi:hypothetical protein
MKLPLTIISLLCATALSFAADVGPPIGKPFRMSDLRVGPKGAAILFYRSQAQLVELGQHREAFQKLGIQVATMGVAEKTGWIVLDAKSVIVAKYFEDDPSQCYTSAAILVRQFGWTPPEPTHQVEGKQITANIGASNSVVAPGQRVALTLDLDLGPNMHVYAPGVEGYIPIDWKMQDSDTAVVHAPVFPRAEKLYLKAIDETVPAYRGHFRLTRDITVAAGTSGRLTIDGSLRYQACDDRVCYIPQTLPLQWTFEYQP